MFSCAYMSCHLTRLLVVSFFWMRSFSDHADNYYYEGGPGSYPHHQTNFGEHDDRVSYGEDGGPVYGRSYYDDEYSAWDASR